MRFFLLLMLLSGTLAAKEVNSFHEAYLKGIRLEKEQKWSEAREYFLEAARLRPFPGEEFEPNPVYFRTMILTSILLIAKRGWE